MSRADSAADPALVARLARREVVVLDGCDGTGKTTLATALCSRHGYVLVHTARPPDQVDLAARYRSILAIPGKIVLDRSFVNELVYGPLRSEALAAEPAAGLRARVRGGGQRRRAILVHLTGRAGGAHAASCRERETGYTPTQDRLRTVLEAFREVFAALADAAEEVMTADTTASMPGRSGLPEGSPGMVRK